MVLIKLRGGQQRRLQSASTAPLVSQMPGSADGLYDHYGLETHSMKSNLSSYRKRKSIRMWVCSQHETV